MSSQPAEEGPALPGMPKVGTRVSLESSRLTGRMWSSIVGWKEGAYLLIETPETHLPAGVTGAFSVDDTLTVRYMDDGMIVGFRSPVLGRFAKPLSITMVAFPHHVQTHSLRRHPRMTCYLPCRVQLEEQEFPRAVIRDISLNGCRIRIPAEDLVGLGDGSENAEAVANSVVTVHVQLPDEPEPQVISGRVVRLDLEPGHAMLRLESTAELSTLVEFVGMFTTRLKVKDIV